jgi:hypothetical protein
VFIASAGSNVKSLKFRGGMTKAKLFLALLLVSVGFTGGFMVHDKFFCEEQGVTIKKLKVKGRGNNVRLENHLKF